MIKRSYTKIIAEVSRTVTVQSSSASGFVGMGSVTDGDIEGDFDTPLPKIRSFQPPGEATPLFFQSPASLLGHHFEIQTLAGPISCYLDLPENHDDKQPFPFVIIAPPFGKDNVDMRATALEFKANGYAVISFNEPFNATEKTDGITEIRVTTEYLKSIVDWMYIDNSQKLEEEN